MPRRKWCPNCNQYVNAPGISEKNPGAQLGALVVLFILGFFTCGIGWILMAVALLAQVATTAAGKGNSCPICGEMAGLLDSQPPGT